MLLPVRFDKSDWLRITKGFSVYAQNFGSRQRSRFLALIKRNAVLAFRDDLRKKSSQYSRHYDILTSNIRMRKRSLSSLVCFRARGSCYLAPRNRDWEKSEGELTSQRLIALRMFLRWFQYSSILTPSAARFKMSFADNVTRLWEREWNRSPKEGLKNRDSQGFISFHFQFKYFIFFSFYTEVKNLVATLLNTTPNNRPTLKQVLQHPWFTMTD